VRATLLVMPALSLIGSSLLAAAPILAVVRVFKVLENATDYSLHNTARHALFLPVAPDEKYQAKAAIDTFFVRFGDLASFGLVAATVALGLGVRTVAFLNVGLVVVWGLLALRAGRRYQEMSTR
jgi:AAA family ATP:ADP antiporter